MGGPIGGLVRLASQRYTTMLEVNLEQVQNALDNGARNIWLTINKRTRRITISDDGDGASREKFEQALLSLTKSIKSDDKMGRFGLGLASPIGKCEYHTFTATPKDNPNGYLRWKFVAEDIWNQQDMPDIPLESVPNLQFSSSKSGRTGNREIVPWRVKIEIVNYTRDRFIGHLSMEQLSDQIRSRFNVAMLKNKCVVHITIRDEDKSKDEQRLDIEPVEFQGIRLPVVVISESDVRTTFKLFLARKTVKGRNGKVSVGEQYNDFRIPFKTFMKNIPEGFKISKEAVIALSSGVFEGEILNNRVRVHSSRRGFEENDHLVQFCIAIDQWFNETGSKHFEETRDVESAERYQDIARRSLQVLRGLRETEAGRWINDLVKHFPFGSRGEGNIENVTSTQDLPEPAVNVTKPTLVPKNGGRVIDRVKKTPQSEIEGNSPNLAFGPKGKKRHIVRDNSTGIGIAHEPLGGNDLWVFDSKYGIITFNTEHRLWSQCDDRGEKTLSRFQDYLLLQACFIETLNGRDWQETVRIAVHEMAASYVFTLCHGDVLSERIPAMKAHAVRREIGKRNREVQSIQFPKAQ